MNEEILIKTFYHISNEDARIQRWLDQNKNITIVGQVTSPYSTKVLKTVIHYKEIK